MRHFARTVLAALGVAALVATFDATAAHADGMGGGGSSAGGGYAAKVEVHLSGDVNQGAVGSVPGPPPMCWWEDYADMTLMGENLDTSDPVAVKKYYEEKVRPWLTGHAATGQLANPDGDYFNSIIKQVAAGKSMTFYHLETRQGAITEKPGSDAYDQQVSTVAKACGAPTVPGPYGLVTVSMQAFETGQEPPPAVAPEDLAAYAYEVMDLKHPDLEWNPHLAKAADATLVNLPTWLWTTEPEALEERQVTAEAAGISVTVTAKPQGMTVSTPVGGTDCSAKQARTAFAPGVDEATACTFTFPSSSVAYAEGFPVQASTGWHAAWTSNVGAGGQLDPKTMAAVTNIPVVEVETLVNSVS